MNRENRTSSRRERDSSEREQRNEVGKVRTDMRGSGMTDRRWTVETSCSLLPFSSIPPEGMVGRGMER